MLATFVVVWRESLEAALVVSILLAYLARTGQRDKFKYIWMGVAGALVGCALFARATAYLQTLFDDAGEEVFQACLMLIAVAVVTAMVLWMHRESRNLRRSLEGRAEILTEHGRVLSLALLAGIAVFREGAEMVLFLWGIVMSSAGSRLALIAAGFAGAAAAVASAWGIFLGASRLNLKLFFQVTSVALLLIAAGMLAQAANRLIGVGMISPIVGQVWNSGWLLDERGAFGSLAAALFGYRSRPSLLELLLYLIYCAAVLAMMRRHRATA